MVRLSVFGLVLATFLSSAAADPASDTCADDPSFRFNGEGDKDCGWVGRNDNRCDRKMDGVPLRQYCPWVCNDCDDVQESFDECQNNPGFFFNLEESKDCGWVGRNPNNRCERQWRGTKVKTWCPEYCGECEDNDDPVDNDGPCEDDATFLYGNNPNRSCSDWVADDTQTRCFEKYWKGEPLSFYCPVTCDTCPSEAPTDAPTEAQEPSEPCCSLNYHDCIDWCGTTEGTCGNRCDNNNSFIWLENGPPPQGSCSKRWSECEVDSDTCCPGLECRKGGDNKLACRPELSSEDEEESSDDEGGCCSLDYKTCIGWCGPSKNSCLNCNHHDGVGWLNDGSRKNSTCKPRWTGCQGSPNSCCAGLECRPDPNNWLACLPAEATEEPTFAPTEATTLEPTEAPEPEYTEADGCCSLDYKECIGWCGPSKADCLGCNHHDGVGWLDAGSAVKSTCKRRWSGCQGRPDSCCPGLVCRKDPNNWLACLPELE